jgi:hypothetical protein
MDLYGLPSAEKQPIWNVAKISHHRSYFGVILLLSCSGMRSVVELRVSCGRHELGCLLEARLPSCCQVIVWCKSVSLGGFIGKCIRHYEIIRCSSKNGRPWPLTALLRQDHKQGESST